MYIYRVSSTVFALIYGTAKNNCIGDCSALIRAVLYVSKALEQLLKKVRCNDVNATGNTEISPIAYAVKIVQ